MEAYNYPWDTPVTAKITSLLRLATLQGRETIPHCSAQSKTADRSSHFFILLKKLDCT